MGGGEGVITKYSREQVRTCICICVTLDIYKHMQYSDNRCACRYIGMYIQYMECRGIYTYEIGRVWRHAPQGKFKF